MSPGRKFPCPCCGYRVFDYQPGFNHVCPICYWEDSLDQLRFANMPGSANPVSLVEAQRNYVEFGASVRRHRCSVRAPLAEEPRDPQWRPIDPAHDNLEEPQRGIRYADSYPYADTTVLYYWRHSYWRRVVG